MTILFLTRHFGCLRNFERPIFQLARGGHRVHLAAHQADALGGEIMVQGWSARDQRITYERLPELPVLRWKDLALRLRKVVDYLRYLEPAYASAPGLRRRAHERTPRWVLHATAWHWFRRGFVRKLLRALLLTLERAVPRSQAVDEYMAVRAPDLVLLTPLLALGSAEMDYLDAARALGFRTVYCVWSWDNLSSKALLRTLPDAVMVWNDCQKQEAITLHGVPAKRIVVTGAQSFDQWFEWTTSRTRDEFSRHVGLPADRKFLLWVCSALLHGSPPEATFVREWIKRLRASADPVVRDVGVLIRPHPGRLREWETLDRSGLGPVAVWGRNPVDDEARGDYFESLTYAAAVVGLNTSAFLEAAIVGRPVHSLLLPEHFENQEGTIHFEYLMKVGGGLLHASRSWDEHLRHLGDALCRSERVHDERSRAFVKAFVRPFGLQTKATDRFVAALEEVACRPAAAPARPPAWTPAARGLLTYLLNRMERRSFRDWWLSPREFTKAQAIRRKRAAKDRDRELARLIHASEVTRVGGSRGDA